MNAAASPIVVEGRFARSANLERDAQLPEPLHGYVVTGRALEVVERVAAVAADGVAGGAWSLTGPYGSGKSSLALLLDALFGPPDDGSGGVDRLVTTELSLLDTPGDHQHGGGRRSTIDGAENLDVRDIALSLIDNASPQVGALVREAHQTHRTQATGFHRAIVTAQREPLSHTLLRGLHAAVVRRFGKIPPASRFTAATVLRRALADVGSADPTRANLAPDSLLKIARCLAEDSPLLVIIDEFGKSLEAISDSGHEQSPSSSAAAADPYLLQQLAEAGQGAGLPIFIITLQHLSFDDYLCRVSETQRREWAKVQGRFEDIAYNESSSQVRALIGSALKVTSSCLQERIKRWSLAQTRVAKKLGILELADPAVIESCYPLHPLTALVLPEWCTRYGQHERTLFSFLSASHPAGVASFIERAVDSSGNSRGLVSMGLDHIYDYFVAEATLGAAVGPALSRWSEISLRIRDAHALTKGQQRLAKTIAVLNLSAANGGVRASRDVLEFAFCTNGVRSTRPQSPRGEFGRSLDALERVGIVTYRQFADEYRIWQGTDTDVAALLEGAYQQVEGLPLAELLSDLSEPTPVVAARHSAQHEILRVFRRRYSSGVEMVEPQSASSAYDGDVLLVVGTPSGEAPRVALGDSAAGPLSQAESPAGKPAVVAKPVVAAIPADVTALESAAREAAAVRLALRSPTVAEDWVAQSELGERLAVCRIALESALADCFSAEGCRWVWMNPAGQLSPSPTCDQQGASDGGDFGEGVALGAGRGSAAVSDAADRAYPDSPRVGNEMLNRTHLTTQGASARRLLLTAMIEHGHEPDLDLTGYGPEVAMYRSFVGSTGMHRPGRERSVWEFGPPSNESLLPAWECVRASFEGARSSRVNLGDVHEALLSPPIGMKAAAVPVLLTAGLLAHADEVAIYEHGTFKPQLTSEVSERMVRNPSHFEIKHFASSAGTRRHVVQAVLAQLAVDGLQGAQRVPGVLSVVARLVSVAGRVPNYTLNTAHLRERTLRVRGALVAAVEPDRLLFVDLPEAVGLDAFEPGDGEASGEQRATDFAERLAGAVEDLNACYEAMLSDLFELLLTESAESNRLAVTGQAAALVGEVLDPEVRTFVMALANDSVESDRAWIEAIATVVCRKAPAEWADQDRQRFEREVPHRIAAFHRLVALHAERRTNLSGGGPFDALRVTVTRSDGAEHIRMLDVDSRRRGEAEQALNQAVDELTQITGSGQRAQHMLLALLSERLLEGAPDANAGTPEDVPPPASSEGPRVAVGLGQ